MAEWKKVLLKGANVTTEQLVATDAEIAVAADSIVFADEGSSGHLKKERVTDFATKLAGTNTATGLKAASGVIGLDKDTSGISLASGDILMVYDITAGVWGTTTANDVGSAGSDTNTTYALSAGSPSGSPAEVALTLTAGGSGSGTDTVKFSGSTDITLSQGGGAGAEDITFTLDTAIEGVQSILKSDLVVGRDADNQIDFSTDDQIKLKVNGGSSNDDDSVVLNVSGFEPVVDGVLDLGGTTKRWKEAFFDKATVDNIVLNGTTLQHVSYGADTSNLLTLNGTADIATRVDTTNVSDNADHHLLFVNSDNGTNQGPETATALTYNPSTENLGSSSTNFLGTASTATNADNASVASRANAIDITGADSLNDTLYFLFSNNSSGNSQTVYADNSFNWNPSNETLTVTNLKVSGTSTTVNTNDLIVTDKTIVLADGSAAAGDANGAGITIDVGSVEANMPELKWNNGGKLTGWTLSNYDAAGATDYPVSVMTVATGAPTGSNNQTGQGSFYVDDTSSSEALYVYL